MWPWGIGAALAIVVFANAIMISIALVHPSTRSVEDHWQRALAHDEFLRKARASAALGWRVEVTPCRDSPLCARLRVDDGGGQPMAKSGVRVTVHAQRADTDRFDRQLDVREIDSGQYKLTGFAIDGLHRLVIDIVSNAAHWTGEQSLQISAAHPEVAS